MRKGGVVEEGAGLRAVDKGGRSIIAYPCREGHALTHALLSAVCLLSGASGRLCSGLGQLSFRMGVTGSQPPWFFSAQCP